MTSLEDGPLTCPECASKGVARSPRIGNRRSSCATCNRFAQAVLRGTHARMREADPETFAAHRAVVEREVYAATVVRYDP